MTFLIDKEEVKPDVILFKRSDVKHQMWYCRIKMPKADRYKTVALKTCDRDVARQLALEHESDIRLRLKHDIPVFALSFREIGRRYLIAQEARARAGQISTARPGKVRSILEGTLERYLGSTPIHLIGDGLWDGYPAWRRENGVGRRKSNGSRKADDALASVVAAQEAERRLKVMRTRGNRRVCRVEPKVAPEQLIPFVSDSTIRFEMSIFKAVLNYAGKKKHLSQGLSLRPPKLQSKRRDHFTVEELAVLWDTAVKWVAEAVDPSSVWYRTVACHMLRIACDTGMRPSEMKNLRWCDVRQTSHRDGRNFVVLSVWGKGKSRKLVAPDCVGCYLERIQMLSRASGPTDKVFTNIKGRPARSLYCSLVANLLEKENLREGTEGSHRSLYSLRHTYATLRLQQQVSIYLLAEQMGTSVQMIQKHYGHVDLVECADRLLQGMDDAIQHND